MNRGQRKLRLARRQAMLAMLREREAMRALSIAIDEEARSAALKERSARLAQDYGLRSGSVAGPHDACELAALGRFTGALGLLAREAERAHADAADQARWQADALASAQARARRLENQVAAASAALDQARTAKATLEECLARELHGRRHVPAAGDAPQSPPGQDAG